MAAYTKLKSIVGEDNFSEEFIDKTVYSSDASMIEGKTLVIVKPETSKQVHELIMYAKRTDLKIVIRGAATGLVGGSVPEDSIVMDLTRMNNISEINKEKKYAVVGPGVNVDELNLELMPDLFFPVIPSSHEVATIGGMIATNAVGLRAVKYGKMENWVDEIEVIDGTGKIYKFSGDKMQDFIGKEGITGVIVKAKLKLTQPIKHRTMNIMDFNDFGKVIDEVKRLKENKSVAMIEFMDKKTSSLLKLKNAYHLIAEFENDDGPVKEHDKINEIIKLRDSAYPALASTGYYRIEDPKVDIDAMPKLVEFLEKYDVPFFGHMGADIIHPCFKSGSEKIIDEMYIMVADLNGYITGEHGIGLAKKKYVAPALKDKFEKLKKTYNRDDVVNKGKII